jgi:hypothetical protein
MEDRRNTVRFERDPVKVGRTLTHRGASQLTNAQNKLQPACQFQGLPYFLVIRQNYIGYLT